MKTVKISGEPPDDSSGGEIVDDRSGTAILAVARGRRIAQTRCWLGVYSREMSRNATGAIVVSTEPPSMVCALFFGHICGCAGKKPRES